MKLYKIFSLSFSLIFFVVGAVFLSIPGRVLVFFNSLSGSLGMASTPVIDIDFYVVLAVAYMYLVALIAFWMFKHPENTHFPLLLANGKLVSSLLSVYIFSVHLPSLIFLANFLVDSMIGLVALIFYRKIKKKVL